MERILHARNSTPQPKHDEQPLVDLAILMGSKTLGLAVSQRGYIYLATGQPGCWSTCTRRVMDDIDDMQLVSE